MFGFMPSILAQGFWQRLGRAVVSVATGAAENYVGSSLNDKDKEAWNEISNDINNGLGLDNNYVNAGNKLQQGKTTDAVVNMGVTAASNSGNQTLITVSKTVQAQNDYVNNVSSGMDQKTAQDAAARQISDALLDDMEERERIAAEKRRQERIATEKRNEYNSSSNTYTVSSSTSSNTQYNAPNRTESKEISSANTYSNIPQNDYRDKQDELLAKIGDLTKEYNDKKEEYQQLINSGVSSEFLTYREGQLRNLYQRIEELKRLTEKNQNATKESSDFQSMIQPTFNDKAEECQNQIKEYQQLINSGISSEFLQHREENMILLYQSLTEEYRNQTEEYQQLINNGIASEFLKYREETLNNMYKSIVELTQQLNEVLQNK